MGAMIFFLIALLGLLAYHLHLQDRARRDVLDLARKLISQGETVPTEMWDRLMAGPDKMQAPKWLAPAFFLMLAVGFALSGIEQDGRGELDERLLLFGVAFLFFSISGISYALTRIRE